MIDTRRILYDVINGSNSFDTTCINEIEEVVDYGLEKTEENIQKVALEYLDEKGFARRVDNLDRAKQHVMESSEYSDTVCVRKRREMEEDLLLDAEEEDLEKLSYACMVEKLTKITEKLTRVAYPRYEYTVVVISDILTNDDKVQGSLTDFESFEMMLNRYARAGWKVNHIGIREGHNHKITMSGFSSSTKETVVVFERLA